MYCVARQAAENAITRFVLHMIKIKLAAYHNPIAQKQFSLVCMNSGMPSTRENFIENI